MENIDHASIRSHFSIMNSTDMYTRLCSFSIAKLDEFICTQDEPFLKLVDKYSEDFPLRSAPTLYILNKARKIPSKVLEDRAKVLAEKGRTAALEFSNIHTVRAVYTRQTVRYLQKQEIYELVIGYEKRIEIVEWNPESPNYSETRIEYSLENALIWFAKSDSPYAMLACCDFAAVLPLLTYCNLEYNLDASLPNLSEKMLEDLSDGSLVRNATFTLELSQEDNSLDANTITIYDKNLAKSKIYTQMKHQNGRVQRSGFFTNHPYLLRAGMGISCKYGRIWTPAHLDRNELITLAFGSIAKLDAQLKVASEKSMTDFIFYYSNREVIIGNERITGKARQVFDRLIYYLAISGRNQIAHVEIDFSFQRQLAENYKRLKLQSYIVGSCPNCGEVELQCPQCGNLLELSLDQDIPRLLCGRCKAEIMYSDIACPCGELCPVVDIYSNIQYLPTIDLLNAIASYAAALHPQIVLPALFKIIGNNMLSLQPVNNASARYIKIEELKYWRVRAHLDSISTISTCAKEYISHATEKCSINNYHPTKADCIQCSRKHINKSDFQLKSVCLLRTFGVPIDIAFDGIHHGREFADILYHDEFDNQQHMIGIHVKKHVQQTPVKGLGRSNDKIKGLYAQIFYTMFELQMHRGKKVDTIGIAIPNRISSDVIDSFKALVIKMGYSFIVVEISAWEKIAQAAIDNAEF